jgi:hypothetical protein
MTTFCLGVYVLNESVWPPHLPNIMAEGTLSVYSMYRMCRGTTKAIYNRPNTIDHGLINCIDSNAKCRHLKKLTGKGTLGQSL